MFDDDDELEQQVNVVDEYYFEDEDGPVCFSILPLYFYNNNEGADCASEKEVYLRGDNSLYPVHKKVVAWRVKLDCEQPNISVLSSEGNWITLLKPRKCYEKKIARSILITVQMLHFVRKQPSNKRGVWDDLWDHLYDVFNKLETKPALDDLRKHHVLIKLFVEKDPVLIKSKILQKFVTDMAMKRKQPKAPSTKEQFIVSGESHASKSDGDYDDKDDKNYGDDCYSEHARDDDFSYRENNTEDNYSNSEENSAGDDGSDGDPHNDGTDAVCVLCDDGGKLISCTGQCKKSFHPSLEDGRLSKCKTLGYTSAQLKGISAFLCKNCEYKQHQCFKCGKLGSSDELNAKVFKCNKPSCGHFYHPKCVAELLEPGAGAYELAKSIVAGMSFTCPVHWCFECGKMEDITQRALQFAVCRRCPKSYHRECLPREISFESKGKLDERRAWELSSMVFIYCRDHQICKSTGSAPRYHKFPKTPETSKTTRQISCSYAVRRQMENRVIIEADKETSPGTSHNISRKCVMPSTSMSGHSVQDILSENPLVNKDDECDRIAGDKDGSDERDKTSEEGVGTPNIISDDSHEQNGALKDHFVEKHAEEDIKLKSGKEMDMECRKNADEHDSISGQEKDTSRRENLLLESMCEQDSRSEKEKIARNGSHKSGLQSTPNIISDDSHEHNGALKDHFVEKHAEEDRSKLKSGKEMKDTSRRENVLLESMCEQDSRSEKEKIARNESNKSGSRNDEVTPDNITEHSQEKRIHFAHMDKATIANRTDTETEHGCGDREVYGSYACQEERNSSQRHDNPRAVDIDNAAKKLRKNREPGEHDGKKADLGEKRKYNHKKEAREAHFEDKRNVHPQAHSSNHSQGNHSKLKSSSSQRNVDNAAVKTTKFRSNERTGPSWREETMHNIRAYSSNSTMGRHARKRSITYSSEGQRMGNHDSYPGTNNRYKYEQWRHINYSSNDYADRRRRSPRNLSFSPADLGPGRRHSPPPYRSRQEHDFSRSYSPSGTEYDTSRRHRSPHHSRTLEDVNYRMDWNNLPYLKYDEYRTSRRHASPPYPRRLEHSRRYSPPCRPRRPEDVEYEMDWNSPPNLHYDQVEGYEFGAYETMDIDPVARYSSLGKNDVTSRPQRDVITAEGKRAAMHVESASDYGDRSDYLQENASRRRSRTLASVSVTDKYAPRLDQTTHHPIGRSSLHYDLPHFPRR
ncbi:hypothetical protein ACP4OV_027714 [Aristida adscensionis]